MIYLMHIRQIVPGKMGEYNDFQVKEFQPMLKKNGIKVAAYWTTAIGNANESIAVFAFDDAGQWQKQMDAMNQDPDYKKVSPKLASMTVNSTSRLLRGLPWSPLK